jgi:hypothetical protein
LTPKPGPSRGPKNRVRSRSRSLTPPPTLSQADLQATRDILRQTQKSGQRNDHNTPVSAVIDLSAEDEDEVLDPELQRIKESVSQRVIRAESTERRRFTESESEDESEDPANQIILLVTWIHDPEDTKPTVIEKEMEFPYPRVSKSFFEYHTRLNSKQHRNFQKLFDTLSDILSIPTSYLTLFYDNMRVYPGSSPHLLKMWEKANLIVCEHRTVRYLQQSRRERALSTVPETIQRRSPSVQSEVDDNTEKLKFTIRSSSIELPIRVRVTTTCGELVMKFLKKAGIPAPNGNKRPALLLDGDRLSSDTTIADLDIEDGDMLEITDI